MRNFLVLILLVTATCSHAAGLPDEIFLKTATQSFTHEYDVAVSEGKIWHKPRASNAGAAKWQLLGKTGLPAASSLLGLGGFDSPPSVAQLSADGDNLIAVGNNGVIYYMKWSTRKWTGKWGQPFSKQLRLPDSIRAWSISHRGPFAGGYSDIDGNFHAISAGVTTLYVLSGDGLKISYADPWLPADFAREIGGPLQNRFRARSLSAGASTLFVISDAGEMYTRLADFDTLGLNPFLAYGYERRIINLNVEKDVRTLPPEEWKKQPSISPGQGRISSAITVLQTGKGNSARELRVEGVNAQGTHGFFFKPINGDVWQFTPTNLPLQKPLLSSGGAQDFGPKVTRTLSGHLRIDRTLQNLNYKIELQDFNPLCSGAMLVVFLDSEKAALPLYVVASSQSDLKMKGAVLLPAELKTKPVKSKYLQEFLRKVFGKHAFVKVTLIIQENGTVLIKAD